MLLKDLSGQIKERLSGTYPDNEINAFISIIYKHVFQYSMHDIIMQAPEPVEKNAQKKIDTIVERLLRHEPIQYILGETEFFGLIFMVTPDVLIPRNETEELVQHIINDNPFFKGNILDIGTGSGCIAIALAKNMEYAHVSGCDISTNAIEIAKKNAKTNDVDIRFFQHDILSGKPSDTQYDIIVSNPPYITGHEKGLMEPNVLKYEPRTALFVPDSDPLQFYRAIAAFAINSLTEKGVLWFEINEAFGSETCKMLSEHGFNAIVIKDINGRDRVVRAQKRPV
jgi:release factor glutamine methyltransferase